MKQTLEPKWEPFALNVAEIGGLDSNFTIDCYDWEKDGANQLIGSLTTTVRDFMFGPVQIALINPEKVGKYVTYILSKKSKIKKYLHSNRLNYKSSGAFSVDNLIPLPSAPLKPPVAPAYFVECCAQKLTRKELIGKTGNFLFFAPLFTLFTYSTQMHSLRCCVTLQDTQHQSNSTAQKWFVILFLPHGKDSNFQQQLWEVWIHHLLLIVFTGIKKVVTNSLDASKLLLESSRLVLCNSLLFLQKQLQRKRKGT